MQWKNVKRKKDGAAVSGDVFNFQIRLSENAFAPPPIKTIFNGSFYEVPNNDDASIGITHSNLGFNLIGNPYPSPVNADLFLIENPRTLYFQAHRSQGAASGAHYGSYNTTGGVAALAGGFTPTGTIQTGQGFLLKIENDGDASFTNLMRESNNQTPFYRAIPVEKHRIWLNLSYNSEPMNQILVGYVANTTNSLHVSIDGKLAESGSSISSTINDEYFVIQFRSLPFENTDVVPLHFKAATDGAYSISIDHVDGLFSQGQNIFIKDNLLSSTTSINSEPYNFISATESFPNRFEIVYQNATLDIEVPTLNENSIIVYKQQNVINIHSAHVIMSDVKVFDICGRLIYEKTDINASTTSLTNLRAEQQVLLVQITSKDGIIINKRVVY